MRTPGKNTSDVYAIIKSEVEKTETLVKERMENVYPLRVPLKVHIGCGANWAEAK
jgi:DNA polymerase I-like protein with 3'-5' exonuclease and polymerase domains